MRTMLSIITIVSVLFAGNVPISFSKNARYYFTNLGVNAELPYRSGLLDSVTFQNNPNNSTVSVQGSLASSPGAYSEPVLISGKVLFSVSSNNARVRISVHDLKGRFVTDIFNGKLNCGNYSMALDRHGLVPQTYVLNVDINGLSHAIKYASIGHRSSSSNKAASIAFADLKKTMASTSNAILSLYDDTSNSQQGNYEYQAVFEKPGSEFASLFGSFVNGTGLQQQLFDSINNLLVFVSPKDTNFSVASHYCSNSALSVSALEAIAEAKVASLLSAFVGRIEYCRMDTTRQNGTDIINVDVWFRRIFRDGLVLDNVSAICVSVNGAGEITSLRVKWPKLINTGAMNDQVTYDTIKTIAMNIISDSTGAVMGMKLVKKVNGSICGIAKSWFRVDLNGSTLLSPSVSFQTRFLMQDGEYAMQFLNVPTMKKYYR